MQHKITNTVLNHYIFPKRQRKQKGEQGGREGGPFRNRVFRLQGLGVFFFRYGVLIFSLLFQLYISHFSPHTYETKSKVEQS